MAAVSSGNICIYHRLCYKLILNNDVYRIPNSVYFIIFDIFEIRNHLYIEIIKKIFISDNKR